jgi:hypothetical protein
VGHYRVVGPLTAGHLFMASDRVGNALKNIRTRLSSRPVQNTPVPPFNILES